MPGIVSLLTSAVAPDHEWGPYFHKITDKTKVIRTFSRYWAAPADENSSLKISEGFEMRLGLAPNSAPISSLNSFLWRWRYKLYQTIVVNNAFLRQSTSGERKICCKQGNSINLPVNQWISLNCMSIRTAIVCHLSQVSALEFVFHLVFRWKN